MAEKKTTKAAEKKPSMKQKKPLGEKKLVLVRIRGLVRVEPDPKMALDLLRLRKNHTCVVVNDNPSMRGMAQTVKDYVAYGECDEETFSMLEAKRKTSEPYFYRLHPPRGGFRKGIKTPGSSGGSLGNLGQKINPLIQRML